MTNSTNSLSLMVHVPADEWAFMKRRQAYLEAVLIQTLRSKERLLEWYDAAQLLEMRLTGLPRSKAGITRLASASNWLRREVRGRGGMKYQYHCTSLPLRAFEELISRILDVSISTLDDASTSKVPEIDIPELTPATPKNTAPPWVLPFMRLLKGGAQGNIGVAWKALPEHLPPGIHMPSEEEAAATICHLGLA